MPKDFLWRSRSRLGTFAFGRTIVLIPRNRTCFLLPFSRILKPYKVGGVPIFALFPVVLAIAFTWIFGAILTTADVWDEPNACRTDANADILDESPWFRVPYPGQWGAPIFETYAIVPMLGGMLASMIESIGDYYVRFLCFCSGALMECSPISSHFVSL